MIEALTKEKVESLFKLANLQVEKIFVLENKYYPKAPVYYQIRAEQPWFLVKTKYGLIELGPRKRVYHLSWEDTSLRTPLPVKEGEEWITSAATFVHAYSLAALMVQINNLDRALRGLSKDTRQVEIFE